MHLGALLLVAIGLALVHFGFPLTYYYYLKKRLSKPWNVKRDPDYKPRVSIIVPTYNEAELIESKLDDLARQDYPRELLEIIVVDSASTDGTPERVEEWARRNPGLDLKLIRESVRRGKAFALNNVLSHASGEVVVVTDVDAKWSPTDTLSNAISWLGDPSVGAVTCLKLPANGGLAGVEEGYREYYNVMRLAESKAHSTPVFHGELAAFRKKLLEELGGFPTNLGADDSHMATRIALMGYRSIAVDNAWCIESVPNTGYHKWRIRRAQHLVQHFTATMRHLWRAPRRLRWILLAETHLHLFNPWILVITALILAYQTVKGSALALALVALGALLLAYKPYRTWIMTQLYLAVASIRNLWTKEIAWERQYKSRDSLYS
jgi:cellulose synthase/poly-beta-1,6-N-acetylglucosamine synthase-like glycosyltransferase